MGRKNLNIQVANLKSQAALPERETIQMLRIKDWDQHFENAASRKLQKLYHVMLPARYDGSRYAELILSPHGVERYAAWCTLLGIAASGGLGGPGQRGYIRRSDGSPHTPTSLSFVTRIPQAVYEDAIPALLKIGWLEEIGASSDQPQPAAITEPADTPKLCPGCDEPGGTVGPDDNGKMWHPDCCGLEPEDEDAL